jgi:hypothetical protein
MKNWLTYFAEREGLADLGQQDLSDDHENPDDEVEPNTPPGGDDSYPSALDELSIIRKCMRIALKAGDQYRKKVHEFLHRLARDIPELQNLVSQLKLDDENKERGMDGLSDPKEKGNNPLVSTPSADAPPEASGGQQ